MNIGKFIKIIVLIVFYFHSNNLFSQRYSESKIKAAFILKFAENLEWPNETNLTKFEISVIGQDTNILHSLTQITKNRFLRNKPFKINYCRDIQKCDFKNQQIIYLSNSDNNLLISIFEKIQSTNILLISDNYQDRKFVMINFITNPKSKKQINFEINKKTINDQQLTILPKLIYLGGTEIDIRELYKKQEAELQDEREKVEKQQQEINKQLDIIKQQNTFITEQKNKIESQVIEIKTQEKKLELQKQEFSQLLKNITLQQLKIDEKNKTLKTQEEAIVLQKQKIHFQEIEMETRKKILEELKIAIDSQENKIITQKQILQNQESRIANQQEIIYLIITILLLILIFSIFIYKNYKQKQRINRELEIRNISIQKQNADIQQQKEEIHAQAELLAATNKELEKLSIVARETDNAVVIMDADGNLEWVNSCFTRIYNFTLEEMINERGKNIRESSTHPEINTLINQCLIYKKPIIYESLMPTRQGKNLWMQTTITPIADERGKILKLVAIDSDITKLKEAEFEIYRKNEELIAQRDELTKQKEYIQEQNIHITSSINYALTIQKAILPNKEEIDIFFDSFIIYRPKDIVSGDFYWLTHLPSDNIHSAKTFFAVVDCTGHGVPGGFMSMIGNRILNELVYEQHITNPPDILENMHKKVRNALKQDFSDNVDGMDIILCRFEIINNEQKLIFSGAKRPLVILNKQTQQLITIKGHRRSVGGQLSSDITPYNRNEINITTNDIIYLYTDGYIDQNNKDRLRYGTERLNNLLKNIGNKSLQEQQDCLEKELNNWQQEEFQRDDITFIGLKLKNLT